MDKLKTGELIKEMRLKQKLTQSQLADQLGVTNKAVSRWETGNSFPDITLLGKLAEILDINIEEIVLGERKEECGNQEALERIVDEAAVQKKQSAKRTINLFLGAAIICCLLLVLGILFFAACFYLMNGEINIEEAKLTCAFWVFLIVMLLYRFGFPLFGLSMAGLLLNNMGAKKKTVKIILWIIVAACFLWLGNSVFRVIYNMAG